MKQQILQLIDRKIEEIRWNGDMIPLQELRKEIETLEDNTIKTIDEMIEEAKYLSDRMLLQELKQRLSTNN